MVFQGLYALCSGTLPDLADRRNPGNPALTIVEEKACFAPDADVSSKVDQNAAYPKLSIRARKVLNS